MALKEKSVLLIYWSGTRFFAKKRYEESLSYYERVLEVQPDSHGGPPADRGIYLAVGQPQKAEAQYAKALAANPRVKSIYEDCLAKAQAGDTETPCSWAAVLREATTDPQAITAYANLLFLRAV
jgi:tetratricopeptide (TPR) repeat protein